MRNWLYLSPRIAPMMLEALRRQPAAQADSPFVRLSPREREVLQLVAEGKATKEVAAILSVSVKTLETHRRALMDTLRADSVAGLTKYAIREGSRSSTPTPAARDAGGGCALRFAAIRIHAVASMGRSGDNAESRLSHSLTVPNDP
jgi:DNA-binding CsgD family transcriptional regulator